MTNYPAPKYGTRRTPRRRSRLAQISETATALGTPLLGWQSLVVDTATEYRTRDRVPYRKSVTVTVPRQSGKSVLASAVAVDTLNRNPRSYGVLIAQTRLAATNRLLDIHHRLVESGLDPLHKFTRGVGNEKITFTNGSRLEVQSPKAISAHGESIDIAILDELWRVPSDVLSGVVPAMVARPRAQLWMLSTAGNEDSELLNSMCAQGRDDPDGPMAYYEWSMPEGADIFDRSLWPSFMPALGETQTPEAIEAAIAVMPLPEILRAFGNVPILQDNARAIPAEWWQRALRSDEIPPAGLSLAVDVNRTPPGWAIAAAWSTEDGYHADLVEHGIGMELSRIPRKVEDLVARFRPPAICVDPAGPAGALIPDLQRIADDYATPLRPFRFRDRSQADVWLCELLRDEALTHSHMLPLESAVEGARPDTKGDAWFFSRSNSYVDLSPLLAVSMAVWSAREHEVLAPVVSIM